jgi:hypothetical protein
MKIGDHSTPKHSNGSLLPLVLHALNARMDATDRRIDLLQQMILSQASRSNQPPPQKTATMRSMLFSRVKDIWSAVSTLSVWGKLLVWLAPRLIIAWGLAQGWAGMAWRWLRWLLLGP